MTSLDEKRASDGGSNGDVIGNEALESIVRNTTEAGGISEFSVVAEGEERTTWFVWILVCCSSISGLLFGETSFPITDT